LGFLEDLAGIIYTLVYIASKLVLE